MSGLYGGVGGPCQDGRVIDHFGVNCSDFARSREFYDRVLGVLGYSRRMDFGEAIGYGRDGHPDFWIADADLGPEYHPGYFGAFVRDPDGNNVEAVFDGASPESH
jgi:catechol 2,3-dioxygenase-like lactoylglutathione lyase family enzyme